MLEPAKPLRLKRLFDRKQYDHDYYLRNKKLKQEYFRDYYIRNKSTISDYRRQYYTSNKRSVREANRKNYIRNKEHPELYFRRENASKSWKTPELVREYFESISKALSITDYTDWYRISFPQVGNLGGMFRSFLSLLTRRLDTIFEVWKSRQCTAICLSGH
jgi:hypothetical protein